MLCWHDMRTLYHLATAAFLALGALPAQARLGETEKEIEKRYGPPVRKLMAATKRDKTRLYSFKGMQIKVTFLDGKSQLENYSRPSTKKLIESEINLLMKVNAPDLEWLELKAENDDRSWVSQDAAFGVTYEDGELRIFTKEVLLWFGEAQNNAVKEGLEGF